MGRAERRRLERRKRLESNRDYVTMSQDDIRRMKEKIREETQQYDVISLLTCVALAEHRVYGFGNKRILRTLEYVDRLMNDISKGEVTIDDYRKQLEEETRIVIR